MRTTFLSLALCLAACAADPATSSSTQNETGENALSANALSANALSANALSANALSANALSANALSANALSANGLLDPGNPAGWTVYSYIVSCALPADIVVIAKIDGADTTGQNLPYSCSNGTCTFPGGLGLTPQWATHELDPEGRGWISSCLFARVNHFGVPDEISLRGTNPALATSAAERELYTVQEGAFYGNWFKPGFQLTDAVACEGDGQLDGVFGGLVDRACARPDPSNPGKTMCGFTYAGLCHDVCRTFDANGTFYGRCHGGRGWGFGVREAKVDEDDVQDSHDGGWRSWRTPITIYVTQ